MLRNLLVLGTCLLLSACANWIPRTQQEILNDEKLRLAAMIARDTNQLELRLAQNLVFTHSNGVRENKQEFLHAVGSGYYRFHTYTLDSIQWRMHKRHVVAFGSAYIDVEVAQKRYKLKTRYTATYTNNNHFGWQLSSWQNTKVADVSQ